MGRPTGMGCPRFPLYFRVPLPVCLRHSASGAIIVVQSGCNMSRQASDIPFAMHVAAGLPSKREFSTYGSPGGRIDGACILQ